MADMMPVQSEVPTEPFSDVREIRKGVGTRVLASDPPHLYWISGRGQTSLHTFLPGLTFLSMSPPSLHHAQLRSASYKPSVKRL